MEEEDGLNEISGIVRHKESGRPLGNLLVVAFDLDPDSVDPDHETIRVNPDPASALNDPATFRSRGHGELPNGVPGDRLGSVLTDDDGKFTITYDDSAFRVRRHRDRGDDVGPFHEHTDIRPDLFLIVAAAESEGQREFDNVIFRSNWARINAGRVETYLIEIRSGVLEKHGIPIPTVGSDDDGIDEKVQIVRNAILSDRAFAKKISDLNAEIEEEDADEKEQVKKALVVAAIRDVSEFADAGSPIRFVQDGEAIGDVQAEQFGVGANQINSEISADDPLPGQGIKIYLYLTKNDMAGLESTRFEHEGVDYFRIEQDRIQEFVFKQENDKGVGSILFADNPISKYCLERTREQTCAVDLTSDSPPDADEPDRDDDTGANDVSSVDRDDLPELIDKIIISKGQTLFGAGDLSDRPDAASVQTSVAGFSLEKGPADATAFYDFDMLQIAFGHVWQQLVDETLVNLGQKAHFGLKNNGRRSIFHAAMADLSITKGHLTQAIQGAISEQDPIPTAILKCFDIHVLEYEAMTNNQRIELFRIAEKLIELRQNKPIVTSGLFGTKISYPDNADRIESLYEQGELLLENLRANQPNATNTILRELQDRLASSYEFTVFAADKSYHSVNFGLFNTYRQKWEPTSYQAGQLAKTIPMAPKEERKYSVKFNRKRKTAESQAEKYNSIVDSETSLTSRAEAEIVSKAQKKTDFDFSAKLSYASSWSKLGIGKDASKDSSEVKKSFRESVLKAAQEFKDEWSLTVDTEDVFDTSESQSGTITNPNDELSVTYLFYQLQRRYLVSERLHRTMPVVMVAMDVPSPHEITEGWVVAHDWSINRVLLDDSFREALEDLAKRNVGSEFALRELRRSLREQRRLVRTHEREFAKLQRDVENKYSTYRDSVGERIEEEHDKRFFKRRLFRYVFGGSGEEPEIPDPEMAKALEQAAADDHAYAVEQAKQLAMTVERESKELHRLVREYNAAMEDHLNRLTAVKRLLTHIKENIFYYMQAIWSMEPPDQRFMRLHKVKVPSFSVTRSCVVAADPSDDLFAQFRSDGKTKHAAWLFAQVDKDENGKPAVEYKPLVEVADLDTVLGFKGNYIIFPLKEHNALTELMAAPYVDEAFGAMDPDQLGTISLEEYSRYVCCLNKEDPEEFERLKPVLREWLRQLLAEPSRNGEEVIVPTDSLFIEMLPSDKSLLEDFKLKHRQMDVMKVRAEVRQMELQNLRFAARLLSEDYDDPDIDRNILVQGGARVLVGDD
ncbi:hypothetical protein [Paracoccus marinaquae]|uniref:EF-hand domain-containing protein n=1 Tax=Paracoccus marinaquae TaxID=2841926 RepID=A0ABS6ANU1_9RHOB|nr:hypothetical protein [Paracoccus marinaquae]MBU3032264.1 hypothetical protein [Paracoccus marinaquae]